MALVVIYNEGASPQNVLDVIPSANTPDYLARTDALINPDISSVLAVARRYWKVIGTTVSEMNTGQKNAVDAAIVAAADQALRASARGQYDGQTTAGQAFRALVKVLLDEINTLRAQHSLADRTLAQAKTAIQSAIDSGDVDEA